MSASKLSGKVTLIGVLAVMVLFCRSCSAAPNVNTVQTEGKRKTSSSSSSLLRIIYPQGFEESGLPQCEEWSVCSRVDTYSRPWVERLCSCGGGRTCPTSLRPDDGHTVVDRSRQYKLCQSAKNLPRCRFFRDVTWTHITMSHNMSQHVMHCVCPENSIPYMSEHESSHSALYGTVYKYHFSCSPQSTLRCRRKEPCRLFTVNKRYPVEEVTTSTLCQCPPKTSCPRHHTESYVLTGSDSKAKFQEGIRNYSGYCGPTVR